MINICLSLIKKLSTLLCGKRIIKAEVLRYHDTDRDQSLMTV